MTSRELTGDPAVTPTATPAASQAATSVGNAPRPQRILVVDDEEPFRTAVSRFLQTLGYEVHTAADMSEALDLLGQFRFAGMLCDVRMPGGSGVDGLPRALAADPDLAVLMLSGVNDAPTAARALAGGALDYLTKPVQLDALALALERALHRRALAIEQRRVEALIREEVALRTAELEKEKLALSQLTVGVAETLINAMEAKDVYLRGHSQRVADLAASIAERMGLDADTVEAVRLAGRLHDVGQIGVREEVLHKPGELSADELAHVRDHVRVGLEILAPLRHIGAAVEYVRDHHEHWDGGGYPRGAAGEGISVGGRVLAAADAFDALTSRRPYREPMTPERAVEYLGSQQVGRLLDPRVFEAMKAVVLGSRSLALTFIDDARG